MRDVGVEVAQEGLTITGTVVHGDARGRRLGFPTANVVDDATSVRDGVWAALASVAGARRPRAACVSVGHRPTFYGRDGTRLVEVHLLDFDGDLYGEVITVELVQWLRPQRRFGGVEELVRQITADVASTRARVRVLAPDAAGDARAGTAHRT